MGCRFIVYIGGLFYTWRLVRLHIVYSSEFRCTQQTTSTGSALNEFLHLRDKKTIGLNSHRLKFRTSSFTADDKQRTHALDEVWFLFRVGTRQHGTNAQWLVFPMSFTADDKHRKRALDGRRYFWRWYRTFGTTSHRLQFRCSCSQQTTDIETTRTMNISTSVRWYLFCNQPDKGCHHSFKFCYMFVV